MKTLSQLKTALLMTSLIGGFSSSSQAAGLISNGGFEAGLTGWTIADQIGSDGTFFVQTGSISPSNGFPVAAPPEGSQAAMTDAGAGGSHVLYQDFIVPTGVVSASIGFSLFMNNGADNFYTPGHLDWAATNTPGSANLNQQARADILSTSAEVFSVNVFQNLFQTQAGDPLISGYTPFVIDITALLQAHQGETLRLRFAETDNVGPLNLGVDNISLSATVPLPSAFMLTLSGISGLFWLGRKRGEAIAG